MHVFVHINKKTTLLSLISTNETNFEAGLVTSIDKLGMKELKKLKFTFLPASVYAYNIGEITLKMKTNS